MGLKGYRVVLAGCFFAVLLILTSCSSSRSRVPDYEPTRIDEARGFNSNPRVIDISIPRPDYITSVREPGMLARLRLVRVFSQQSSAVGGTPEYRVFDIQPDSPYAMLGLMVGDVLVAVEGWVLFEPDRFPRYVQLLQFENSSELEIRRADEPLLLRISLTPPLAAEK